MSGEGTQRCAFCANKQETEIVVTDPSEVMDLPLGEDAPERSVPVCEFCRRVARGCPTIDEEPWPDWSEIDYPVREVHY